MPTVKNVISGNIHIGSDGRIEPGVLVAEDGFVIAGLPLEFAIRVALARARYKMDGTRGDFPEDTKIAISLTATADLPEQSIAEESGANTPEAQANTAGTTPPESHLAEEAPPCPACGSIMARSERGYKCSNCGHVTGWCGR